VNPTIPKHINPFALATLEALQKSGLGKHLSLGGALGLALYHEFRSTKDVDAWWTSESTEADRQNVIQMLEKTLEKFGEVEVRRFGDVVSLDLYQKGQICFNFQIARRSAQLLPFILSPWDPVKLDSFEDLVASKMTALVERGIPRDFLDIYEICHQKICSIQKCWELWKERETKRGVEHVDASLAAHAIRMHLTRIEKMRPLDSIQDGEARRQAKKLREWFKNDFCQAKI
jgi:hypothetical protein